MGEWIHIEGKVWNNNTCETPRCNQIIAANRDADYILRDIKNAIEDVDKKLKKEGTSAPEIEIIFGKEDLEKCLETVKKQGQEEAWDLAQRILLAGADKKDAYTVSEVFDAFGLHWHDVLAKIPVEEALEKDKVYQKKKEEEKKLHVGDEVEFASMFDRLIRPDNKNSNLRKGYVIDAEVAGCPECVRVLLKGDGTRVVSINSCKKTGKHNPDVEKVMASFEKGGGEQC